MRAICLTLLLLPLTSGQHLQVIATKSYVDNAVANGNGGAIPPNANLPGNPTTTTQPVGTNNTMIATTAFVHAELAKAQSIILYSGITIQGSSLASGASESGTFTDATAQEGKSCTANPSDNSLPPIGIREYCRVMAGGVITVLRRNETSDSITTTTKTYAGAVLQ